MKYDGNGVFQWTIANTVKQPLLPLINQNNIYVGGVLDDNYAVVKYNSDGIRWEDRIHF